MDKKTREALIANLKPDTVAVVGVVPKEGGAWQRKQFSDLRAASAYAMRSVWGGYDVSLIEVKRR